MVEICSGKNVNTIRDEHRKITAWLSNADDNQPEQTSTRALDSVRKLTARKRCMMLAWEALAESLDKSNTCGSGHVEA